MVSHSFNCYFPSNNFEYWFILATRMSSLVKYFLKLVYPFLNLVACLIIESCFVYILDSNPWSNMCFENIFSQCVANFSFFSNVLWRGDFEFWLSPFYHHAYGDIVKKFLQTQDHKDFLLCFYLVVNILGHPFVSDPFWINFYK